AERLLEGEGCARAAARGLRRLGSVGLSVALVGVFVGTVASVARLNVSPSAPLGLYRAVARPVARGDLVVGCVPVVAARLARRGAARLARDRGYLAGGNCPGDVQPVLKRVGAIPGDMVAVFPDGVTVNGRRLPGSATAAVDSWGRALPHVPWGTTVVATDEV